jgi:hypothetical protein
MKSTITTAKMMKTVSVVWFFAKSRMI